MNIYFLPVLILILSSCQEKEKMKFKQVKITFDGSGKEVKFKPEIEIISDHKKQDKMSQMFGDEKAIRYRVPGERPIYMELNEVIKTYKAISRHHVLLMKKVCETKECKKRFSKKVKNFLDYYFIKMKKILKIFFDAKLLEEKQYDRKKDDLSEFLVSCLTATTLYEKNINEEGDIRLGVTYAQELKDKILLDIYFRDHLGVTGEFGRLIDTYLLYDSNQSPPSR